MDFRSSAAFGKRSEFVAMGELLRHGFDVYMSLACLCQPSSLQNPS